MDKVLEILKSIKPGVDFEKETDFVTKGILASFDIIRLVNLLNNEFDIEITPLHLTPENFNSVESIYNLVKKLEEED